MAKYKVKTIREKTEELKNSLSKLSNSQLAKKVATHDLARKGIRNPNTVVTRRDSYGQGLGKEYDSRFKQETQDSGEAGSPNQEDKSIRGMYYNEYKKLVDKFEKEGKEIPLNIREKADKMATRKGQGVRSLKKGGKVVSRKKGGKIGRGCGAAIRGGGAVRKS